MSPFLGIQDVEALGLGSMKQGYLYMKELCRNRVHPVPNSRLFDELPRVKMDTLEFDQEDHTEATIRPAKQVSRSL